MFKSPDIIIRDLIDKAGDFPYYHIEKIGEKNSK